jgi:hypothetical protein
MKNRNALILFFSVFTINGLFAQKIIRGGEDFYVTPKNDSVFMASCVIKNNSKDSVWMWFDSRKSNSLSDNIRRYFFSVQGDFSLLGILNDESVTNKRLNIIDQSFVKLIRPDSEFRICIMMGSLNDRVDDALERTLVFVKSSLLNSGLRNALIRNVDYLYNSDLIVINWKNIPGR